jgi:hypothetical protein
MTTVRFTSARAIVERGKVHATRFEPGETSSDPDVAAVALRNGWAVDVDAPETTLETAPETAPATAPETATAAAPTGQPKAHPEDEVDPKPVMARQTRARKAAPENKAASGEAD